MIKIPKSVLKQMERQHPGIMDQIMRFENADLPSCSHCASTDTADVQVGIIGRTIYIGTATTKFHLIPNGPRPGRYFCNHCRKFFDTEG